MDNIEKVLERWTNAEEIRLRAGEIDSDTMRDVLAVTNAMAREVRKSLNNTFKEEYEKGIKVVLG